MLDMMATAAGELGWDYETFWGATLREYGACLRGVVARRRAEKGLPPPLTRRDGVRLRGVVAGMARRRGSVRKAAKGQATKPSLSSSTRRRAAETS